MSYLVIAASLNPKSRSRELSEAVRKELQALGVQVEFLNLADHLLPMCDGDSVYDDPKVKELTGKVKAAEGILVSTPIYNFYANAAAKNLIELTGSAWENKVVGFLCAAGGESSYMSIMSLAGSLMLDFRSFIIPRYVYASSKAFEGNKLVDKEVRRRIAGLAGTMVKVSRALEKAGVNQF